MLRQAIFCLDIGYMSYKLCIEERAAPSQFSVLITSLFIMIFLGMRSTSLIIG